MLLHGSVPPLQGNSRIFCPALTVFRGTTVTVSEIVGTFVKRHFLHRECFRKFSACSHVLLRQLQLVAWHRLVYPRSTVSEVIYFTLGKRYFHRIRKTQVKSIATSLRVSRFVCGNYNVNTAGFEATASRPRPATPRSR